MSIPSPLGLWVKMVAGMLVWNDKIQEMFLKWDFDWMTGHMRDEEEKPKEQGKTEFTGELMGKD